MGTPSENEKAGKGAEEQQPVFSVYLSVAGPLLPLAVQQGPQTGEEEGEILWLAKQQRAPEYLNLLYDLAIAAVLSVFGDKHQIMNGNSVVAYFSYFIVIWWVWASQVLYDTRFQANDWLHRLFKFLQLATFTYIGVFAQNFDPTNVVRPADITTQDAVSEVGGADSFQGVALAYAVSRLLLAAQYVYMIGVTRKQARRQYLQSFLYPVVICLVCALFWIIAALLKEGQAAKLVLGYLALAFEISITLGILHLKDAIAPDSVLLSERFADLTLVILAEGALGIVKTLADVVAGFGLAAGGSTVNGYSECVCSLVVVYGIWHFTFHAFNPEARFSSRRATSGWAFLHLPFHFVILLVLSGMKGVALFQNVSGAMNILGPIVDQGIDNTGLTSSDADLDSFLTPENILQLNKLDLKPSFQQEINSINDLYTAASNGQDPSFDPDIAWLQYAAQLYMDVGTVYEISFSSQTQDAFNDLLSVSTAWDPNESDYTHSSDLDDTGDDTIPEANAENLFVEFIDSYALDLATPSLFFLPCAGCLIILAALLTVLRTQGLEEEKSAPDETHGLDIVDRPGLELHRVQPVRRVSVFSQFSSQDRLKTLFWIPIYIWEWVPLGAHLLIGSALALSGFMDTPSKSGDVRALDVLIAGWTLPVVAICFAGLIIVDLIVLVLVRIAKGGSLVDMMSDSPEITSYPLTPGARTDVQSPDTFASLRYGKSPDLSPSSPEGGLGPSGSYFSGKNTKDE